MIDLSENRSYFVDKCKNARSSSCFVLGEKHVLTRTKSNSAKLWDFDRKLLSVLENIDSNTSRIEFLPSSDRIITSGISDSGGYNIELWATSGVKIAVLEKEILGDVNSQFDFFYEGDLIATSDRSGTLKLWNLDGKRLSTFEGNQGAVTHVEFHPSQKMIATSSQNKKVQIWTIDGRQIAQFDGIFGAINSEWNRIFVIQPSILSARSFVRGWGVFEWPLEKPDVLIDRACERLSGYLVNSLDVNDEDRALCGF